MRPQQVTPQDLQNLIDAGIAQPEILAMPETAALTRAWWVYFHPEGEEDLWLDLDAWFDYCDRMFPDVDPEALDIALGCC